MNRRLTQMLVFVALMLLPVLAWGADGAESNAFKDYVGDGKLVAIGASFVFGLVASLTPCVFPMVPITVAIFGATEAKSRARGAALSATFVLGIAALFTPMGIASAMSGKLMGSALSNQWVVIALAVLFIVLASSMFGAFELALPSGLNNRLSTVGGVGFKGAFVMGLVMGLVAAPCTGPFLTGMVTWIATTGNVALGSACMFSFALGLGVLFFIAGTFAVNLPKGGAWMMGIKWASGVGLAYMSFSYLRDRFEPVRNLVNHPSYTFGAVGGAILLVGLILGTVHVIAERRRSPIAHLSKPTKLASILPAIAGAAMFATWLPMNHGSAGPVPEIAWQNDETSARAKALADGKPVIIDFGASWCAGCKELEHDTFPHADVKAEAQRFVAIRVDASDDDAPDTKRLSAKYKVVGLPTVIMLDKAGNEIVRINKFVPPAEFVAAMKKVPAVPGIAWQTDEAAGREKALAEGKPVLLDFGAHWCAPCKEFDEETFPNADVKAEAQRFVSIKIDATDDSDPNVARISKKYGVVGMPTVILLDKAGNEVRRFNKFAPPAEFLAAMKKVPAADGKTASRE